VLRTKTMLKIKKRICFSKKRKYSRFMLCVSALSRTYPRLFIEGGHSCAGDTFVFYAFLLRDLKQYSICDSMQCTCLWTV